MKLLLLIMLSAATIIGFSSCASTEEARSGDIEQLEPGADPPIL